MLDRAQSLNATSDSGRTHTNYPLTAVCYPGDDTGLHLSYDQRYFDESTVQSMLSEFKRLLLALVEGFHGDMAELALVSEQERAFLIDGCNQSDHAYPLDKSYVELFEAQVAAHPERIAVSCTDRQLSYTELNIASNRLGHALIEAGVGCDQPVALLAERGAELPGMIIGSFKAGAGYLPLDPALPNSRLSGIIAQSATPLLVCSAECPNRAGRCSLHCPKRADRSCGSGKTCSRAIPRSTTPSLQRAGQPRLCDLHFRLYRIAERRDGRAARHAQ